MYIKEVMLGCHSVWRGKPQANFGLEMYNSVLTEASEVNSSLIA